MHCDAAGRGRVPERGHHRLLAPELAQRAPEQIGRHHLAAGRIDAQHHRRDAVLLRELVEQAAVAVAGHAAAAAAAHDRAARHHVRQRAALAQERRPARVAGAQR
jgi:hypothetical protein